MSHQPITVHNLGQRPDAPGIYIGREWAGRRASEWANQFRPASNGDMDRQKAVWSYLVDLMDKPLRLRIHELRGQDLLCWCAPKLCHGHALAFVLANQHFHEAPCRWCGEPLVSRMNFWSQGGWSMLYEQGICRKPGCGYYGFAHRARGFTIDNLLAIAEAQDQDPNQLSLL